VTKAVKKKKKQQKRRPSHQADQRKKEIEESKSEKNTGWNRCSFKRRNEKEQELASQRGCGRPSHLFIRHRRNSRDLGTEICTVISFEHTQSSKEINPD
jgi:hypothetical protein